MKKRMQILFLLLSIYSNALFADGIDKSIIEQYLPEEPIIIEVGAHKGFDTLDMARRWPKAKIYAFEPVPWLFNSLRARTKRYKNVFRFKEALSSVSGQATFYVSSGTSDGSGSLLQPKEHLMYHPGVLFRRTITVSTVTLDDWVQRQGVSRIDLMWLDMQGFELDMLKAVSEPLLKTVKVIHIEVSLKELYTNCPLYPEVRAWLEDKGFQVALEDMPWVDGGNVLFVRQ